MVIIIDFGMGNLGSILNMAKKIGVEARITSNLDDIGRADKLILPGVGSFDSGMKNLRDSGLLPVLNEKVVKDRVPILGICLGMQLFAQKSEEGISSGLGWIEGEVVKFRSGDIKVPHMGWNTVKIMHEDPILDGMPSEPRFFFLHSYHLTCSNRADILTTSFYGGDFVSSLKRENIIGVQFHPEKSHKFGMQLLRNFTRLYQYA